MAAGEAKGRVQCAPGEKDAAALRTEERRLGAGEQLRARDGRRSSSHEKAKALEDAPSKGWEENKVKMDCHPRL